MGKKEDGDPGGGVFKIPGDRGEVVLVSGELHTLLRIAD